MAKPEMRTCHRSCATEVLYAADSDPFLHFERKNTIQERNTAICSVGNKPCLCFSMQIDIGKKQS